MTALATLRDSQCSSLHVLPSNGLAASGPTAFYVYDTAAQPCQGVATRLIPREAECTCLWLHPGALLSDVRLLYYAGASNTATVKDGQARIVLAPLTEGASHEELILRGHRDEADAVESLSVVYQTVLVVCGRRTIRFYRLDPTVLAALAVPNALKQKSKHALECIGECPSLSGGDVVRLVSARAEDASAELKELVVAHFAKSRVHVQVMSITGSAVSLERGTPSGGCALPKILSSHTEHMAWCVNWSQQSIQFLLKDTNNNISSSTAESGAVTAAAFSFAATLGTTLHSWDAQPAFLSAATRPILQRASGMACNTGCTFSGAAVGCDTWFVDTVTGPTVLLTHAQSLEQVALPNTVVSNTLLVLLAVRNEGNCLYALCGRLLYEVFHSQRLGASKASEAAANTLCGWLVAQKQQRENSSPKKASCGQKRAIAMDGTVTRVLGYLSQGSAAPDRIVRDAPFVSCTKDGHYTHALLAAIEDEHTSTPKYRQHLLKYLVIAHSVHPYTVLKALQEACNAAGSSQTTDDDEGFVLAVAAVLADKPSLQSGGLRRSPEFDGAADAFFSAAGACNDRAAKKRYLACVCRVAVAALAVGALGPAALLAAVADIGVLKVYGGRDLAGKDKAAIVSAEEQQAEAEIADCISVLASYSDWALTAASTLGVISAHVGDPSGLKKEASLRDGKSHPIRTSRNVQIEPFRMPRPVKQ